MLQLIQTESQAIRPKSEGSDNSEKSQKKLKVLAPGTPYLGKRNGELVMVRDKQPRTVSLATSLKGDTTEKKPRRHSRVRELFGDTFGAPTGESVKVKGHRRSASTAPSMSTPTPVIIDGVTYVPHPLYTAPLQQQPFLPYYSVPPTPQLVQQPTFIYPPPEPAKAPKPEKVLEPDPEKRKATEEEKEQLRDIDAHYHKIASKDLHRHSSDPAIKSKVETTTRTTVTITKHICAQCSRIRSTKYHHDNPIKPGEEPVPAFCRKCQRDASPTSSSGSDRDRKKKKSKDNRRRKQKKYVSSPSGEGSPSPQHRRQRSVSEEPRSKVGFKDTINARGSYVRLRPVDVEDADKHKSRGRSRHRGCNEEPYDRALSPIVNQSDSAYQRYEPVMHGARREESTHRRSPSPIYRIVEAPAYYKFTPRSSEEQIPSGFVEGEPIYDHVYDAGIPLRRKSQKIPSRFVEGDHDGSSDSRRDFSRVRYENKVPSRMPSLDDEHDSLDSSRSYGSQQRRQKERHIKNVHHREGSRRPRPTERVVVRDTYISRPRAQHETKRRGESVDRMDFNVRDRTQKFSAAHEAASYYIDDWGNHSATQPAVRKTSGFRRDRYQDSELGPSEASYDHIPRAPTPPSRPPSSSHQSRRPPGYPLSTDSDIVSRRERKGKAPQRYKNYSRGSSTVRAYGDGAEKSVVLSPVHSRETSQTFAHPDEVRKERSWVDGADSECWDKVEHSQWTGGRDERKDNLSPEDMFRNREPEPGAWKRQHKRGASFESGYGEDLFR